MRLALLLATLATAHTAAAAVVYEASNTADLYHAEAVPNYGTGCFRFRSAQHVEISDGFYAATSGTGATVAVWARVIGTSGTRTLYSETSDSSGTPTFRVYNDSGDLKVFIRNDAGQSETYTVEDGVADDTWRHYVVTISDIGVLRVWIDGAAPALLINASQVPSGPYTLTQSHVGAYGGPSGMAGQLGGYVAHVVRDNRAWSEAEANTAYGGTLPADLTSYHPLTDNEPTTATVTATVGNDGTATNPNGKRMLCNAAGWPIRMTDEPIDAEYWIYNTSMLDGTAPPNRTITGHVGPMNSRTDGWGGWPAERLDDVFATTVRIPDGIIFHGCGGPLYGATSGTNYCFDAMIHARDGHLDTQNLIPPWRSDANGLGPDTTDRSYLYNTLDGIARYRDDLETVLYLGRVDNDYMTTLSDAAVETTWNEVLAHAKSEGFDGVIIDVGSQFGGYDAATYPEMANPASKLYQLFQRDSRKWKTDATFPWIGTEAITVLTVNDGNRAAGNVLQSPTTGERFGVPTSSLSDSVWTTAYESRNNNNSVLYPNTGTQRWFCLCSPSDIEFVQGDNGPRNARRVFAAYGVLCFPLGFSESPEWLASDQDLPPKIVPRTPISPTAPKAGRPPQLRAQTGMDR